LRIAGIAFKVHASIIAFVAVPLVVVYDTTGIASDQELVVFGKLDASDSCLVIVDHVDWSCRSLVQVKDTDLVV